MKASLPVLFLSTGAFALGAAPASVAEALVQGEVPLHARLRCEGVEQTGLRKAEALTLRTRPGYTNRFKLDRTGAGVGVEWDGPIARKSGKALAVTAKLADFRRDSPAFAEVRKIWLQFEHTC